MIWWRRVSAVTWARSLEFLRDRSTLGWNLLFPLLMVIGFAVVFSGPGQPLFKVAVLADAPIESLDHAVLETPQVHFFRAGSDESAMASLQRHRIDLLIDLRTQPGLLWLNRESPKGEVLEQLFRGAGGEPLQRREVSGRPIRYVDWVLPGLLGMNMMFSCLFGIGYVIVRYRKSGYLKRLYATPLSPLEFVIAQLASRLALILSITVIMFAGLQLLLDFRMDGSYALLFLVALLGATAMTAMGLLVAARVTSEELAGGLLNLFSWPMMFLSGVFYSLDGTPEAVQQASRLFPLTHLLEAAREVMLDGAGLREVRDHLLALTGMSVAFLMIGSWTFRWTPDS